MVVPDDPDPFAPQDGDTPPVAPPRATLVHRRWFPWAAVGVLVLSAFPLAALVALFVGLEQAEHPPTCYGIGFGCVPGPWSTAALLAMIVYAPAVTGLAVLLGVLELFGPRAQAARSAVALVAGGLLLVVALLLVLNLAIG